MTDSKDITTDQPNRCQVVTSILTESDLEISISDAAADRAEVIATADVYGLILRDHAVGDALDDYRTKVAELLPSDENRWSVQSDGFDSSELTPAVVERLRDRPPQTQVLLTSKKKVPASVRKLVRRYVEILCNALGVNSGEKDLILGATDVHSVARFWHPSHEQGGLKLAAERLARILVLPGRLSQTARILGNMYSRLDDRSGEDGGVERFGADVLMIVDLFSELFDNSEAVSRNHLTTFRSGLEVLAEKILSRPVVETFLKVLEQEVDERESLKRPNRVVVYSDRPDGTYALKTKLMSAEFEVLQPQSVEALVDTCRNQPPSAIVMRLHAMPLNVIKVLQEVINNGIPLGEIPTFLMVRNNVVNRLVNLLEMGIEDIVDLDGSIEMLITKIKKIRARSEAAPSGAAPSPVAGGGGGTGEVISKGHLSAMNLIDLLQALGPSQRTVRVRIDPNVSNARQLVIYFEHGRVTYARSGETEGQSAISEGMQWRDGTWAMEQVAFEDLPEPNVQPAAVDLMLEAHNQTDLAAEPSPD